MARTGTLSAAVASFLLGSVVVSSQARFDEPLDYAALTKIRDAGLSASQVMDHASWLTDVHGPRLTGTPAISAAADWVASRLASWGLTNIHRETFPFGKGWTLRRFSAHLVEPQPQTMIGYPKTWSAGTNGPVTAEVVKIDVRTAADLARYRGRLGGRIVVVQPAREVAMLEGTIVGRWTDQWLEEAQTTPFSARDPFLFAAPPPPAGGGRSPSTPTLQQQMDEFFVSEGVVAVLDRGSDQYMVRGDNQMSWMTQRVDGGTVFVSHGGPRDERAGTGIPTVTLAVEHYNRIIRILEKDVPVTVELDIDVEFHDEETENGFNLVAELPGTDLAHEIVLLGAHLDSYSWATGATDNAAGVAVMMEAMRLLASTGVAPRRTVRVGFWGGEEEGLLGSRAYVRDHLADRAQRTLKPDHASHVAYYNIDNGTGRIHGLWLQGNFAAESIFRRWFEPLRDLGVTTISPRSVRGSDYASFDEVGIPAFQFMQDRLEYNSRTHHSNMDVYDRLQRDALVQMAVVVASVAYSTASRDEPLPRKPLPFEPVAGQSPSASAAGVDLPAFELIAPEVFGVAGGQPNAWADYDNDGDLDLFVGFRDRANRLYRNDGSGFTEVAADVGLADEPDTRAAAWGDFDADGHLDLYVGFTRRSGTPNRLYRNLGDGAGFVDVAADVGVTVAGESRQPAFVDFDNDGDVDLFIGLRDAPNAMLRNDDGRFVDVAGAVGLADERKTVGAVWFDEDLDGDLDLYVANQDGTLNGLFRNEGMRFVDVAPALGIDGATHPRTGSNGPSVADVDNDGDFDIFVANYGPNFLFRRDGAGYVDVAAAMGVAGGDKATPSAWGDFDNDGRIDLYVSSYVDSPPNGRDYLYRNGGSRFTDVMPALILEHPASHGVQWVDYDGDGNLDLALADNNPPGWHPLYRNTLRGPASGRSVQVRVLDAAGRHTRAGSEVRVYRAGSRDLLGTRLVDTGGGYASQSAVPVHVGLSSEGAVDIEVTVMSSSGRRVVRIPDVEPRTLGGQPLVVRVAAGT